MNVDWISRQLDFIYFAYGIFLAALFLICLSLHFVERDRPEKPSWLLLSLFGLTFAVHEWLELVSFLVLGGWWSSSLEFLLRIAAFLFLLEFGRRGTPRLSGARATWTLYGVLFLLVLSGLPYGLNGIKGSLRYFLGLPAGILAAWAFFQQIKKQPAGKRSPFLLLSIAVAVFAVSAGVIVPKSGFALAGLLNNESFLRFTGFPVQLLRSLLVLVITILLGWYSAISAQLGRRSLFGVALALALLTTIGCGWYLTEHLGGIAARALENDVRAEALRIVSHVDDSLRLVNGAALISDGDPCVSSALITRSARDLDDANGYFDRYQQDLGLSVVYLLDARGITVASSNRNAPDSFVGKSYAFRPYFKQAIAGKPGSYFATGITSGERGYYASSPVFDKKRTILGVVAVKLNVDFFKEAFEGNTKTLLLGPEGVIFMSNNKDLLNRALWPVGESQRTELSASGQFKTVSFEPLLEREPVGGSYLKLAGKSVYALRLPISVEGWSIVSMLETRPIALSRMLGIGITFVISMVIMFVFMFLMSSENALQASLKLSELRRRNEVVLNEQLLLQQFIAGVTRNLQSPEAMSAVLQKTTEVVVRHLGAAFARIWTVNPATRFLELQASAGLYMHLDGAQASIPLGRGKIGQIAQEGIPLFTNTVIGDPGILDQEWARREGMQAFAGYPLLVEGRVIGVLALFARQPLSESIPEVLGMAATFIASYIDRKHAEGALKESEERYRNVYTTAPLAFVLWDRETRITDWNLQAEKLFGWTREEIIGQRIFDYLIPASARPQVEEIVRLLLAGTLPSYAINENNTKSGRIIVCEWNNSIIGDPGGNVAGVLSLGLDITERKRVEAVLQEKTLQLEELTHNLEQKVTAEIAIRTRGERMLVQQSKMAAMGEMLGAIAHQWRQPLNTLGLCVQNIGDACAHGDLDRSYLDSTVQKSMDQIRHMSTTIDDFRNFFLPDKAMSKVDVMAAVGDVISLLSAQLTSNDIGFRLTCHTHARSFEQLAELEICPEKTVEIYRNEFEHVILNLIINARDAIATRRATAPDRAPGRGLITFDFFNREGTVIIEVGDNGTGIPDAIMPRIFEPYFTSKKPSAGTGIGLYMSKIMIEDHMKGSLAAKNGPEGAVFSIVLRQAEQGVAS